MNRIKYLFILLLFTFFIPLNIFAVEEKKDENEEYNYKVVIEDDANLLTSEEISELKKKMIPLTEYGNIIFKTIQTNNTPSTSTYASSYYHSRFGTESGTLLLIDMNYRKIYIFSDGENYKIISKNKATIITDNVYKYASYEDYYKCAEVAFTQIETLLEGNKILEPMKYISNTFLALTIAFLINFIHIYLSSNIKSATKEEILKKCNSNFNAKLVNAKLTGTRKVYSPPSNSSSDFSSHGGGGFSGGGFSGGGSSGGGGGHRF